MSQTLKSVIANAILKVSTDPAYAGREYADPSAAREDFTKALIAELFPDNPSVPAVKPRGKPGPKPKPKLDENGEPIRKVKSPKTVVSPDSLAQPSPPKPAPEAASPARKARPQMSVEAKAAMVAKRKATMEAKKAEAPVTPEKAEAPPALPASPPKAPKKAKKADTQEEPKPSPKKAKKPSAEPESVNLDKFTPTQKKKLVEIVGDKVDKKDVLSYLNGLSNAAFHDKKLEDHFRDYAATLAKPEEPETQQGEVSLIEQEFDGETYAVNPETKRVYTVDENGNATPVGYIGMGKFEKMELEEYDE